MDPDSPDLEARRLFVSAALSAHAARCVRGSIAADSGARDLLAFARRLAAESAAVEDRHHLIFDPTYPGVTAGVETVGGGPRLVLACAVFDGGAPLGSAFTALIPGRRPQVSVAPVEACIPAGWRPPEDFS